jgi:hypothetical protein
MWRGLFTALVSIGTGVLFGLAPAIQVVRESANSLTRVVKSQFIHGNGHSRAGDLELAESIGNWPDRRDATRMVKNRSNSSENGRVPHNQPTSSATLAITHRSIGSFKDCA